jgi:hypothetical protein
MSKYNLIDIYEQYQIGSGWTKDFDYDGMLNVGLKTSIDTPIEVLKKMSDDFEDVNYHRENSHLQYAIDAIEIGDMMEAEGRLSDFHAEIRKTQEDQGMDMSDDLGAYMASKMEEEMAVFSSEEDEDKYIEKMVKRGLEKEKERAAKKKKEVEEVTSREGSRIEGLLSIPLKAKFLEAFQDLYFDLVEEDPFMAEDVVDHLGIEMLKHLDAIQAQGDKLAGITEEDSIEEAKAGIKIKENNLNEMDVDLDQELRSRLSACLAKIKNYEERTGEMFYQEIAFDIENIIERLDDIQDVISNEPQINENSLPDGLIRALKVDGNGTKIEIEMYMKSLKQSGDKFDEVDDYVEDFKNYVADKSLQEHFGRFMKDYQ